jgi:hypothetical protein
MQFVLRHISILAMVDEGAETGEEGRSEGGGGGGRGGEVEKREKQHFFFALKISLITIEEEEKTALSNTYNATAPQLS